MTNFNQDYLMTVDGQRLGASKSIQAFNPALVDCPPEESRVVAEEPFGPILPVLKWRDEDDVIRRANRRSK